MFAYRITYEEGGETTCLKLRTTGRENIVPLFSTRRKADRYCRMVGLGPDSVEPLGLIETVAILDRELKRGARWMCCDPDPGGRGRLAEIARFLARGRGQNWPNLRDVMAEDVEN
jgi:hypothetical protein